jgi:hypothetical protein
LEFPVICRTKQKKNSSYKAIVEQQLELSLFFARSKEYARNPPEVLATNTPASVQLQHLDLRVETLAAASTAIR